MPRLHTKRAEGWGTGFYQIKPGKWVEKSLDRESRSDKWRKARNQRRRMRTA